MNTQAAAEYPLDNAWERGQRRLRGLELVYNPGTKRRLSALGLEPGWACLEAGAGAGSIARWLGEQVGPRGSVVAADVDISLLTDMPSNVQVRQLDVRVDPLPEGAFDLIHTRLLLNFIPELDRVLDKFVAALRPGGWLLLEEGDMSATGALDEEEDHARVGAAWRRGLAAVAADVRVGKKLPRMVHERGLGEIGAECEIPFAEGGSAGVEFMLLTVDQLNERTPEGILDAETISRWRQKLAQRGRWFASLGIVATQARRVP